jgi:hypothetical protein
VEKGGDVQRTMFGALNILEILCTRRLNILRILATSPSLADPFVLVIGTHSKRFKNGSGLARFALVVQRVLYMSGGCYDQFNHTSILSS